MFEVPSISYMFVRSFSFPRGESLVSNINDLCLSTTGANIYLSTKVAIFMRIIIGAVLINVGNWQELWNREHKFFPLTMAI